MKELKMKVLERLFLPGTNDFIRYGSYKNYNIQIHYNSFDKIYYFKLLKDGNVYDSRKTAWGCNGYQTEMDCIEACQYAIDAELEF